MPALKSPLPTATRAMPARQASDKKQSLSDDVIDQIKTLAKNAAFVPGAKLPSERDLAKQLGVSRPSVRQALSTLVQMGVLQTRQGSGTVLADSSANILRAPFELLMLIENPSAYELYEIRELIEVHLAGRAAERRTDEDLATLESLLKQMGDASSDDGQLVALDVAFHAAVAAAAHAPIAERMCECLQEGIRSCMESTLVAIYDRDRSFRVHVEIVEGIRSQSATEARRAMTIHMAMATDELKRTLRSENATAR
jgi:GntR family transcriptional repressor for pyruvate dehydrogenase complex